MFAKRRDGFFTSEFLALVGNVHNTGTGHIAKIPQCTQFELA